MKIVKGSLVSDPAAPALYRWTPTPLDPGLIVAITVLGTEIEKVRRFVETFIRAESDRLWPASLPSCAGLTEAAMDEITIAYNFL